MSGYCKCPWNVPFPPKRSLVLDYYFVYEPWSECRALSLQLPSAWSYNTSKTCSSRTACVVRSGCATTPTLWSADLISSLSLALRVHACLLARAYACASLLLVPPLLLVFFHQTLMFSEIWIELLKIGDAPFWKYLIHPTHWPNSSQNVFKII